MRIVFYLLRPRGFDQRVVRELELLRCSVEELTRRLDESPLRAELVQEIEQVKNSPVNPEFLEGITERVLAALRATPAKVSVKEPRRTFTQEATIGFRANGKTFLELRSKSSTFAALTLMFASFGMTLFQHWHTKHFILQILWLILLYLLAATAASSLLDSWLSRISGMKRLHSVRRPAVWSSLKGLWLSVSDRACSQTQTGHSPFVALGSASLT